MTNDNDIMHEATEYRPAAYALVETEEEGEVRMDIEAETRSYEHSGKSRFWSCSASFVADKNLTIAGNAWFHLFDENGDLCGATPLRYPGATYMRSGDTFKVTWRQNYYDYRAHI